MLDPEFPLFMEDLDKLRKLGVIEGNRDTNNIGKEFIDKLVDYMKNNPNEFMDYDLTTPILVGIEEILLTYNITNKDELDRMKIIMTGWIDGMLKGGGFYDLN
jgi:hypothetical protein